MGDLMSEESDIKWDKMEEHPSDCECCEDAKTVARIRKVAAAMAFDELTSPVVQSTGDEVFQMKLSSIEDAELFKVAKSLATYPHDDGFGVSLLEALQHYEDLGGKYKHAFGTPMFAPQQMAGSPALAGGMARRATTTLPSPQQAQPTRSPATTPKAQQVAPSSPAPQTAAPAAAPATAPAAASAPTMG